MRLKHRNDYEVTLLRFVANLSNRQGEAGEICQRFEREYHDQIPLDHYEILADGVERWREHLDWARLHLREEGLLDAPESGVWRITRAGLDWVRRNPNATRITPKVGIWYHKGDGSPKTAERHAAGITLEMLEQTRKTMPADDLVAEEQAKAITKITPAELCRRTQRWLDGVHAFLNGKNSNPPSQEVLCDWIHFCYAMELHREVAALFSHVHENEVELGAYRRAKCIAEVSRSKLVG